MSQLSKGRVTRILMMIQKIVIKRSLWLRIECRCQIFMVIKVLISINRRYHIQAKNVKLMRYSIWVVPKDAEIITKCIIYKVSQF